jgi:hypothetical protein
MIRSSLVLMPANLASSVETMGQQRPRKYRSLELLITTIITREASWQVKCFATYLCLPLYESGNVAAARFFIDFADDDLESQVDVGGVVYAGIKK